MKWQVNEMASQRNGKLIKYQVDKMASCLNGMLMNYKQIYEIAVTLAKT